MGRSVAAIWAGMLLVTYVGVVPVTVVLLRRLLAAAENVERYSAEMLVAGEAIARHTADIAALQDTIATAPRLVSGAESIERQSAAIRVTLAAQSLNNGRVRQGEATS